MRKLACITGASRGIGEAIAKLYAKKGYDTLIISHASEAALERVSKEIKESCGGRCQALCADISKAEETDRVFDWIEENYPGLDVLVNNAAVSYLGLLQDMDYRDWIRVIDTNLSSLFLTCKRAIPLMLRAKRGSILNISSVWGSVGASCEVAYSAAKGGVNTFTKALAKELAPSHIRVNALALGAIDTSMNAFLSEKEKADLEEEIPWGRMGSVEEVAENAYFIASKAAYMTGQVITVDGGWL